MSRCFPYPPPGHTLSSARNEALIESIKLQKQKQEEKEKRMEKKERRKEQKEKRKERKEKRKERKEKRKERKEKKDKTILNSDKSNIVKDHNSHETDLDPKNKLFLQNRRETESEQFEQSSLTEEHGRPDSLPIPSSSADSTENSNKRKRHSSSIDGNQGYGKAISIRLPPKRENRFHSLANGQQPCSISRQTVCSVQHKDNMGLRGNPETFNIEQHMDLRSNGKEMCSASGQNMDTFAPGKTGVRSMPNAVVNPMQAVESQYKELLENLFPPRLHDANVYPGYSDWLFQDQKRNEDERAGKRQRQGSDSMSCSRSSALWPRAEYLRDIDAYVLPFVVPY